MQLSPANIFFQFCLRPNPRGVINPSPVITTRLEFTILTSLTFPFIYDDFINIKLSKAINMMLNKKHYLFTIKKIKLFFIKKDFIKLKQLHI